MVICWKFSTRARRTCWISGEEAVIKRRVRCEGDKELLNIYLNSWNSTMFALFCLTTKNAKNTKEKEQKNFALFVLFVVNSSLVGTNLQR